MATIFGILCLILRVILQLFIVEKMQKLCAGLLKSTLGSYVGDLENIECLNSLAFCPLKRQMPYGLKDNL